MPTKHTEFQEMLENVLASEGKLALPNVKEILDPQEALSAINRCTPHVSSGKRTYYFKIRELDPPRGSQTREVTYWPHIFLHGDGMGGRFDGSGVILAGIGGSPKAYSFAMCEHEWNESGANHMRGWHPRRCTKCGFDASIDSGD